MLFKIQPWWLGGRALASYVAWLCLGGSIPAWGMHDDMVPMDPLCCDVNKRIKDTWCHYIKNFWNHVIIKQAQSHETTMKVSQNQIKNIASNGIIEVRGYLDFVCHRKIMGLCLANQMENMGLCLYRPFYQTPNLTVNLSGIRNTFKILWKQIQWGCEIWASLDFEWSKKGRVANGPDSEWNMKWKTFIGNFSS